MAQSKHVHFMLDISQKLETLFSPDRTREILSNLNTGEQRILDDCWEQLYTDLSKRYMEPANISIPMFMFHFHNYA